jgi:DNA repair photolyase
MSALLPILQPETEDRPLVGIARLASLGHSLDHGHEVEYFSLPARSLLNRCTAERMPFTWTINPYRGCEFACKYCYARYTHEFMEMHDGLDFERKIYVKQHAAEMLRRDLRKVKPGEDIAIGTATDPYQPAERRFEVTRSIIEELTLHEGLSVGVVSKSTLMLRDIDLFKQIAAKNDFEINLTVTTIDSKLARILEPRAPRPDLRLKAIRKLTEAGIHAGVIIAPVMPEINDSPEQLGALVKAVKDAGGHYVFANALFLKPCSEAVFMPWLEKEFPNLARRYHERYEKRAFLPDAYRKRLSSLMAALRTKHGFPDRTRYEDPPKAFKEPPSGLQLQLF